MNLKMLGLAALAAMALTAFAAVGSASATTLEVEGVKKNAAVGFTASLESGATNTFKFTDGRVLSTCTGSELNGTTEKDEGGIGDYTGPTVGGNLSEFVFTGCTTAVPVHKVGSLSIAWTKNTEGTVSSSNAEFTVPGPFGGYITCKTGPMAGTDIGTLTGVAKEQAILHVNTVINCGFSVVWNGTYRVTSPSGLGVLE